MNEQLFKEYRKETGKGVLNSDHNDEIEWLQSKLIEARNLVKSDSISDVMPRYRATGSFSDGHEFIFEDTAKDAESFEELVRLIYPTLKVNSIVNVE